MTRLLPRRHSFTTRIDGHWRAYMVVVARRDVEGLCTANGFQAYLWFADWVRRLWHREWSWVVEVREGHPFLFIGDLELVSSSEEMSYRSAVALADQVESGLRSGTPLASPALP